MNAWRWGKYVISADRSRLDLGVVHGFLKTSYWAGGISEENVRRRIENSLVFGMYDGRKQNGFARVVTDYAAFAYLADVFVLEPYRGVGLGGWLIEVVLSHPDLHGFEERFTGPLEEKESPGPCA